MRRQWSDNHVSPLKNLGKKKEKCCYLFFVHKFRSNDAVSVPVALEKVGKV